MSNKAKCGRCGQAEVRQEGRVLAKASGPDAVQSLSYNEGNRTITANVCDSCTEMLQRLGWS